MSQPVEALHRVLVATDFSACSEIAIEQAALVAERTGAELTIIHVLADIREAMASLPAAARWELVAGDFQKFEAALNRESDARLQQYVQRFEPKITVTALTVTGTPFVKIIQEVERRDYDLVFVGTRGHSRLHRLLVGSTAQRLVRHCPTPVWVVKSTQAKLPLNIVTAVDFSETSGRALAAAARIAHQTGAQLHVLHVAHEAVIASVGTEPIFVPQPSKREVNRAISQHLVDFVEARVPPTERPRLKVAWGTPWHKIETFARQIKADLVVMGTVGRSGITNLLVGNTAERVLPTATRDVLTVKPAGFVSRIQPALTVGTRQLPNEAMSGVCGPT